MASNEHSSLSREDQVNSLIAAWLDADRRDASSDPAEFIAQHQEFSSELREFFADHARMRGLAGTFDSQRTPTGGPNDPTLGTPGSGLQAPPVLRYFGDYELVEEIARGGMGVVYRARQAKLNRIVAVKMILGGQLASSDDVERFHKEAEAAAQLDHPGIVPIFEVGQHHGQHYFSMSFVEGQSLAVRVAGGPLPVREAAEIVRAVAEAVQYAHDKGVIHRDLKPGNILVGVDGKPRVTDFGLAKLTESGSDLTGTGQILGTPSFMPPEQAAAQVSAVGRASDIYSLGAVLFCLLTGRPPFQAATALETLLQVQKQEPLSPRQLNPAIPLDLDTIILKCLDKSPSRRYPSARALADELSSYLEGRPITARRVSRVERFWRWCKREPVVASLAGLFVLALILGTTVSSYFALNERARAEAETVARLGELAARREEARQRSMAEESAAKAVAAAQSEAEQRRNAELAQQSEAEQRRVAEENEQKAKLAAAAEREAKEAALRSAKLAREANADTKAFSDFLNQRILSVARPTGIQAGLGVDVTVAEALREAEKHVEKDFAERPAAEALARLAIGVTWRNLGKFKDAEQHLRKAVELSERTSGPNDVRTLQAWNSLGVTLKQMDRIPEAVEIHQRTLERARAVLGDHSGLVRSSLNNLAAAHSAQGHPEKAKTLLEESLALRSKYPLPVDSSTVADLSSLGIAYRSLGNLERARELFDEAYETAKEHFGPDHPLTLTNIANQLSVKKDTPGNIREKVEIHRNILDLLKKSLGNDHQDTLFEMGALATAYRHAGLLNEAIATLTEQWSLMKSTFGPSHRHTLSSLHNLAQVYVDSGNVDRALPLRREHLRLNEDLHGTLHAHTLGSLNGLMLTILKVTDPSLVDSLCESELGRLRSKYGQSSPGYRNALTHFGVAYWRAKRFDRSVPLFEEYFSLTKKNSAPNSKVVCLAYANLGINYRDAGRLEEGISLLEEANRQLSTFSPPDASLHWIVEALAEAYLRTGSFEKSETLYRQALALQQNRPVDWWTFRVKSRLGAALLGQTKYSAAEPLLLEGYAGLEQRAGKPNPPFDKSFINDALEALVKLYAHWQKPSEAAKWKQSLAEFRKSTASESPAPASVTSEQSIEN